MVSWSWISTGTVCSTSSRLSSHLEISRVAGRFSQVARTSSRGLADKAILDMFRLPASPGTLTQMRSSRI